MKERQMQSRESKVVSSKALDASLVVTECSGTKSDEHITSSSSGTYITHVVDADIRPVNDQVPSVEVHLTTQHNVLANVQQHTNQSEPSYDTYLLEKVDSNTTPDSTNMCHRGGEIDQDAEHDQVKSPLLKAEFLKTNDMVEKEVYNELSNRFLQLEKHCISLEISMQQKEESFQAPNLVIRKRVEDFQLGIESYQTQLNLTKPCWEAIGLEFMHDYKILDSPKSRTVKEFKVNKINPGLNTRFWTTNDVIKSKQFMFAIKKRLKYEFPRSCQSQRDLPRDNSLVSVEVLRSDTDVGNPVKDLLKIESTDPRSSPPDSKIGIKSQDFVMSNSEDSMVTYTEVSSPFEDLSDIGSPGVILHGYDGLPMMLEDPYAYVEDEDDVLPEFEEEESFGDDAEDEDEEEEHLALADSVPPPAYRTTARMSIRAQTPIPFPLEAEVDRLLTISTPPSSLTLLHISPLSPDTSTHTNSEDSIVTYTAVSSPFKGLSNIRSPGVDGPPVMPEDLYAYVVASFQAPLSPDYVPGPEKPEQAPLSPEFVPEPVYLEFMPPEDDVLLTEEQPQHVAVLPTTDSQGYIPESDPEEDPDVTPRQGGNTRRNEKGYHHNTMAQLAEALTLLRTLQTQLAALQSQQTPARDPAHPDVSEEAGSSS
ncbi:hypothetical protein Tco_1576781 [Tanacetum coccineum]